MSDANEHWPDRDRDTRPPSPPPPPRSCDCRFHIYGDPDAYPPQPDVEHDLPDATFAESLAMHRALGVERRVLVHADVYGSDYTLLKDAIRSAPDPENIRAVVTLADDVKDRDLADLMDLGVCAGRFHIDEKGGRGSKRGVERALARLREIGWRAHLHLEPAMLMEFGLLFDRAQDVPMIVEQFGRLDFAEGVQQKPMTYMLDRLEHQGWWMLLSDGARFSAQESGWDDAIPFARAFIASAPERMLWGSDWPHVRWPKKHMPNDAETVELLYRYVDGDAASIQAILVDNPARSYGFRTESPHDQPARPPSI